MAYSEKVIDHYENPRNVGGFDKNDPNVATGMVGAPACGDVMKLQLKLDAHSAGCRMRATSAMKRFKNFLLINKLSLMKGLQS